MNSLKRGSGMLRAIFGNQRGTSIVEMMIATTLGTVLMASMFSLYYAAAASAAKEESRSAATREARMATMRLAREFRLVGLMATEDINGDSNDINTDVPDMEWSNNLREDFEYANTYEMVVTCDVDNDGFTETVRYFQSGDSLMQEIWQWDRDSVEWMDPMLRVLARNVDYLMFKYFDGDENTVPNPVTYPNGGYTLSAGERIRVTAVDVTIVTHSDREEQGYRSYMSMPDGAYWYDNFERVRFNFMIRGRNLSLDA